jgi:hypothetical protein
MESLEGSHSLFVGERSIGLISLRTGRCHLHGREQANHLCFTVQNGKGGADVAVAESFGVQVPSLCQVPAVKLFPRCAAALG